MITNVAENFRNAFVPDDMVNYVKNPDDLSVSYKTNGSHVGINKKDLAMLPVDAETLTIISNSGQTPTPQTCL